jgi:hypothetical protein
LKQTDEKRPLGTPRPRWDDNIKADLNEYEWGCGVDSSGSGQSPMAGSCEHNNEPLGYKKFWEFIEQPLASQKKIQFHGVSQTAIIISLNTYLKQRKITT